jgi:hypothetical protein
MANVHLPPMLLKLIFTGSVQNELARQKQHEVRELDSAEPTAEPHPFSPGMLIQISVHQAIAIGKALNALATRGATARQ